MPRLVLLAAVVAVSVLVARSRDGGSVPPPQEGRLRVATYNIRAGLGGIEALTDDLRGVSADLVALQEVERGMARSRSRDQAGELGRALGMEHAFAASFTAGPGEHGVAVLSRYPLEDTRVVHLPKGSGRIPRSALIVRARTPQGPVVLACVHLERPWEWPFANTRTRLAQIDSLFAVLAAQDAPVVVAGDFNSFPWAPEGWKMRRRLRNAWIPWRDGWATTFSLRAIGWPFGGVPIDHVYHDDPLRSRGLWVAPPGASDHRMVVADLELRAR